MTESPYTIVTFSPVQGFIEKSRKLRDLFGSSFLLSYLARSLCDYAKSKKLEVIAPATPKLTQGIPNQIIICGDLPRDEARERLLSTWKNVATVCRQEIERLIPRNDYHWQRAWDHWRNHCWEFFWAQSDPGGSISEARRRMNQVKRARDWMGINWIGESSTLSGADAIAWPGMLDRTHPKPYKKGMSAQDIKQDIQDFYTALSEQWGEGFLDADERLSIPELIKRMVTHPEIADKFNRSGDEFPLVDILKGFKDINRHEEEQETGWFQGDGDSIGKFLRHQASSQGDANDPLREAQILQPFSQAMIDWGENFKLGFNATRMGRIIYAGGDDFLGVLYRDPSDSSSELTLKDCLEQWLYGFQDKWKEHHQPITVSVGFVWASPGVPQRDILQHCRQAEQSAKANGRDRLAIRILFNGGNHLEWTCPWRFLEPILRAYRDREGGQNWGHLNEDIQTLLSRHAFSEESSQIAAELFKQYFPECAVSNFVLDSAYWFNSDKLMFETNNPDSSGILGYKITHLTDHKKEKEQNNRFNQWFIDLARIGVHLFKKAPAIASI